MDNLELWTKSLSEIISEKNEGKNKFKKCWSYSRISKFLNNPAEYNLIYNQGWNLKVKPVEFTVGSLLHKVVEHWDINVINEDLEKEAQTTTPDQNREIEIAKVKIMAKKYIEFFDKKDSFKELEIVISKPFDIKAILDEIYIDENNDVHLIETKYWSDTSFSAYERSIDYTNQTNLYAYIYYLKTGIKIKTWTWRIAKKPRLIQKKSEDVASFIERIELEVNTNPSNYFIELKKDVNWDANVPQERFNEFIQTIDLINQTKHFPINEFAANQYKKWDYSVFFDGSPQSEIDLLFKKGY